MERTAGSVRNWRSTPRDGTATPIVHRARSVLALRAARMLQTSTPTRWPRPCGPVRADPNNLSRRWGDAAGAGALSGSRTILPKPDGL